MTGIANCTDLLRQMVAIPSDSGHEAAFAAFLEQFLREELEMRTELHHIEGAAKAVDLELTAEECAYLEEPYVPHKLVGVMAQVK